MAPPIDSARSRMLRNPLLDRRGIRAGHLSRMFRDGGQQEDAVASKFMTCPVITVAADASRSQAASLRRN